jgi:hypothetical protein
VRYNNVSKQVLRAWGFTSELGLGCSELGLGCSELGLGCSELGLGCSELGAACSELGLGWFGMVCDDCGDSGHPNGVQLSPAGALGQPNGLHCAALD